MIKQYRELKEKYKVISTDKDYTELFETMLVSMFEYKNPYDGFYQPRVELSLLNCGKIITVEKDGELVTVPAFPVELPNKNGFYEKYIGSDLVGNVYNVDLTKDKAVLGYNNSLGLTDLNIERYVELLTDIDVSLKLGIINSRNNPIPTAKDSKTRKSIEETIKLQRDGKTGVVLDSNILSDIANNTNTKSIDIINLSDPSTATTLQYLSKLHDDVIRRFWTIYGHNFNANSGKMAQMSTAEIEGSESFSWVVPYDMLKQRKIWCEEVNKMFGTNISVDFSPTWKVQFEKFKMIEEVEEVESAEEVETEKDIEREVSNE